MDSFQKINFLFAVDQLNVRNCNAVDFSVEFYRHCNRFAIIEQYTHEAQLKNFID
jgi:hypothetical protein